MTIYSIPSFWNSKEKLTKKQKDGYALLCQDIYNSLRDLTIDQIYSLPDMVRLSSDGVFRVNKVRIPNSTTNESKRDGYRLVILVNKKLNHIAFLNVYPKKGKYGREDQEDWEYEKQIQIYQEQLKSSKLAKIKNTKELQLEEV